NLALSAGTSRTPPPCSRLSRVSSHPEKTSCQRRPSYVISTTFCVLRREESPARDSGGDSAWTKLGTISATRISDHAIALIFNLQCSISNFQFPQASVAMHSAAPRG